MRGRTGEQKERKSSCSSYLHGMRYCRLCPRRRGSLRLLSQITAASLSVVVSRAKVSSEYISKLLNLTGSID
eukprot:IDg1133t1